MINSELPLCICPLPLLALFKEHHPLTLKAKKRNRRRVVVLSIFLIMYDCYCSYEAAQLFYLYRNRFRVSLFLPSLWLVKSPGGRIKKKTKKHQVTNPCVAFNPALGVDHGNADFKEVFLLLVFVQHRQAFMTASACKHLGTEGGSESLWWQKHTLF